MAARNLPTDYAVLGGLLAGPAHGYELHRRLDQSLGPIWHIAQSQLYSTLNRLRKQGLLTVTVAPQGNRPPRKVYSLTEKGAEEFWGWAESPVHHVRDLRGELLTKLYFLRRLSPERISPLLDRQAKVLERLQYRLSRRETLPTDDRLLGELTVRFRLAQVESALRWLDECRTCLIPKKEES